LKAEAQPATLSLSFSGASFLINLSGSGRERGDGNENGARKRTTETNVVFIHFPALMWRAKWKYSQRATRIYLCGYLLSWLCRSV